MLPRGLEMSGRGDRGVWKGGKLGRGGKGGTERGLEMNGRGE